jgi:hypothetical protein
MIKAFLSEMDLQVPYLLFELAAEEGRGEIHGVGLVILRTILAHLMNTLPYCKSTKRKRKNRIRIHTLISNPDLNPVSPLFFSFLQHGKKI